MPKIVDGDPTTGVRGRYRPLISLMLEKIEPRKRKRKTRIRSSSTSVHRVTTKKPRKKASARKKPKKKAPRKKTKKKTTPRKPKAKVKKATKKTVGRASRKIRTGKPPKLVKQYAKEMANQTGLSYLKVLKSEPVQNYWSRIVA